MKEIKLKGLDEVIYYDKCDNGLKVYLWVNKRVNTYYATLSVAYGSIYNEFKVNNQEYNLPKGVAHFLEHVKFNEDKDTTAHDYFFKNGADTNAFTTFHYTNYQVMGSENAKDNIMHLLDFVQNNYFSKSIVNNEKGIIIEESKMGEDDPYTVMLFKHLDNIFYNYEHKYVITGREDDIKKITIDDIEEVFNTFYHPQNMFLVVTGNFNPYEIMENVRQNQNNKEFLEYQNPVRIIPKESKKVRKSYEEVDANVTNKKIKIGIKIAKNSLKEFDDLHKRIYINNLLKANFGSTSDFRNELLEKEIISNISYMCDIFDDYIVIMITIDSDYPTEVIEQFTSILNNISIDKKTFERMKKASIASLILDYEDVEIVNSIIQTEILNYGDIIPNIKKIYESITYEDMQKFIKLLDLRNRSILVLNPLQK